MTGLVTDLTAVLDWAEQLAHNLPPDRALALIAWTRQVVAWHVATPNGYCDGCGRPWPCSDARGAFSAWGVTP